MAKQTVSVVDDARGRRGIALVVVLGFLSVMTIISVGLAVAMRTERLASANHINMTKARLLCNAALSDSMMWLEEAMALVSDDNRRFVVAPCFRETSRRQAADLWSSYFWMLPSRDPNERENYDNFGLSLVDGLATNYLPYIPIRYRYELPSNPQQIQDFAAQWIHVKNPDSGKVEGRYMYVIFEASGFVDMNYLRREIAPGFANAHDIEIFFGNQARAESFYSDYRPQMARFETAGDLLNSLPAGMVRNTGGAQDDWFLFSYSPPMKRIEVVRDQQINMNVVRFMNDMPGYGDGSDPVFLEPGSTDYSDKRGPIVDAFEIIREQSAWRGVEGATTADDLFLSLQDYLDSGFTPVDGNHNRPTVKPVPMINEVHLAEDTVEVEVWKPFVGPTSYDRSFRVDVELEGEIIVDGEIENISVSLSSGNELIGIDQYDPVVVVLTVGDGDELAGEFDIEVRIVGSAGETLDEVRSLPRLSVGEYAQVNDPRFNHLPSQWEIDEEGSLWEVNSNADFVDRYSGATDGDYLMYTARGPLMTPGDLGYLPVAPWRTIKLYEDPRWPQGTVAGYDHDRSDMDRVLDYFTMRDSVTYGLQSVNTGYDTARGIGSIFDTHNHVDGGFLSMYLGEPLKDGFLHRDIIASGYGFGRMIRNRFRAGHPSVNLADFGQRLWHWRNADVLRDFKNNSRRGLEYDPVNWDNSNVDIMYSELRMSHLMRRASALGTVRQNMFVVCIWTQVLGDGEGEEWETYPVLSEAQAVAKIWRDAYPVSDGDQYHPKFIRFMRWM